MTLAAQVSADDFLMNCPNGELYKYSKSFSGKTTISVRKDADWKPWCEHELSVSDGGAKCLYEKIHEISVYIEKKMTSPDLIEATIKLETEHKRCNEAFPNSESLLNYTDYLRAIRAKPHLTCSRTGDFLEISLDRYVAKYTVPVGKKYRIIEHVEVTTELVETLDFITKKHWLAPKEETDSNKQFSYSRACKKYSN